MRSLVITAVALLVLANPVRADKENVPLTEAPKSVLEAAKKRFPKAEVVSAGKDTEDGKTVYELNLTQVGKRIDLTLTPEGIITLIKKKFDAKDLPEAVAATLNRRFPKATYNMFALQVTSVVKDGKETVDEYFAMMVTADKKQEVMVWVAADGKIKNVGYGAKKP